MYQKWYIVQINQTHRSVDRKDTVRDTVRNCPKQDWDLAKGSEQRELFESCDHHGVSERTGVGAWLAWQDRLVCWRACNGNP